MTVIDEQQVRALAEFRPAGAKVASCYLDVDGRRHPSRGDMEQEFDLLLRRARARLNGQASAGTDLDRIERFVRAEFERANTRGLVIFSCAAHQLWEVIELAVPVRSQIVVAPAPYVRQLEAVLQANRRFGVLLVDRQRARVFVYHLGELVGHDELFEQLPRHDDDGGTWDHQHVQEHSRAVASVHLRHSADVALRMLQEYGFDHLILGAPDDITTEIEADLHPYLRERLVARVKIPPAASEAEVRAAAFDVGAQVEREYEAALVAKLRDAVGSSNGGVTGLSDTVEALADRRVDTLVVSRGFVAEGWHCDPCGSAALVGPACKTCGADMERLDDVVEQAIECALASGAKVVICDADPDLDVAGRIGALLRF